MASRRGFRQPHNPHTPWEDASLLRMSVRGQLLLIASQMGCLSDALLRRLQDRFALHRLFLDRQVDQGRGEA